MDEILQLEDINQVSDKNGKLYSFLDGFITTLSEFHEEYENQLADRDREIGEQLENHRTYLKKLDDDREAKFTKYTKSFSNYVQNNMREIERLEDEYETLRSRQKTDASDAEKKSSIEFNSKMKTYCLGPLADIESILRKCEQTVPNNLYAYVSNTSRFVAKWEEEQTRVIPGEYVIDFAKNPDCVIDYLKEIRISVQLFESHNAKLSEYKATSKIEGVAWADRKKYVESLVDEMILIAGKIYRLFAMSEDIKKDAKEYFGGIKKTSINNMRDAHVSGVEEAEKAVIDKRKAVAAEIKLNMTKYNRDIEELNRKYNEESKTKRVTFAQEEVELKEKWDGIVSERLARFYSDMENIYPSAAIDKMMSDARGVCTDITQIPFAEKDVVKNVAIGELLIDVPSEFKDGEAGKVINKFFTEKYATLFAKNEKNADAKEDTQTCEEAVEAVAAEAEATAAESETAAEAVDESVVAAKSAVAPAAEEEQVEFTQFSIPYSVSMARGIHACIKHKDKDMDKVAAVMNSLAIRTLWSVPTGLINFRLFDMEYMETFNPLRKLDPGVRDEDSNERSFVIGGRICDGASLIGDQLSDARMRFDKRLLNSDGCEDILEYNNKHDKKRDFEVVLNATYPQGMSSESINRMAMLIEGCGKWGFSSINALSDSNEALAESPELRKVHERLCSKSLVLRLEDADKLYIESSPNIYENGATLKLYTVPTDDNEAMSRIGKALEKATK